MMSVTYLLKKYLYFSETYDIKIKCMFDRKEIEISAAMNVYSLHHPNHPT